MSADNDPPKVPEPPSKGAIQYRVYFFNGGDHIRKVHEFEADDDAAATKIAESWREDRKIELWQCDRMVKSWDT